ncbi:MAG TPA: hypothetical protein VFU38_07660 [Candidatus Krumholzibacteria bacterium]|nr:hypothetical protein [Candidatus Krumholzibacteria bacterium]
MDRCIPIEALGTLDALSPDDPVRRHAEACPRCSAALAAYREFLRADSPRGANIADADRRLARFINDRVEGVEKVHHGRFRLPTFRWAVAVAAVIVGATVIAKQMDRSDRVVLRGEERVDLSARAPRTLADGSVEFGWNAVPDADAYQVVLLREDLTEVARMVATTELAATLSRSSIPSDAVRWQVVALREGAIIVESTPQELP